MNEFSDFDRASRQTQARIDAEERRRQAAMQARLNVANEDRSPDDAAKANQLARATGVPPRAVDPAFLKAYTASQRAREVEDTASVHVPYAMFMSDPDNAAAAADDTPSLRALGESLSPAEARRRAQAATVKDRAYISSPSSNTLERLWKLTTRGLVGGQGGGARFLDTLLSSTADPILTAVGAKPVAPLFRGIARASEEIASTPIQGEQLYKKLPSIGELVRKPVRLGEVFQFMLDSTAASATGTVTAVTNPIASFASRTGNIAQERAINDDRQDATFFDVTKAAPAGAASTALDRFGFERIIGAQGRNAMIRIAKAAAGEAGTEFTQGVIENAGGSVGTKRGFRIDEALSAGAEGALGGVGMAVGLRVPQEVAMKTLSVAQGYQDAERLGNIVSAAEASKLRARDPELFRQFVDQAAEGTGVENVYIPVDALETYLQSDEFEALPQTVQELVDNQIDEARARGGSIVVPVGIATTELVGTKAWAALKDDVRITAGGMSLRETQEQSAEVEKAVAEAGKGITTADTPEDDGGKTEIYNRVKSELLAQGRSSREAEVNAVLRAEQAAASGARIGMTAAEYEAFHKPVTIESVDSPAQAGRAATLDQPIQDAVVNIGLATNDGAGLSADQAIAALEAIGVKVMSKSVRQSATEPTLIAKLDRPLTPEEANAVSEATRQEAIAQRVDGVGDIYGPAAENWRPFNDAYFLPLPTTAPALAGLPENAVGPNEVARQAAASYMAEAGLPYNPPTTYAKVDTRRAKRIAQAFGEMKHDPNDPLVRDAYAAMIEETLAQWLEIKKTGLIVEFIEGDDPYGNPTNAILDVRDNNHLWVYPTSSGFGSSDADIAGNPLLATVEGETISGRAVQVNDIFRIVHDYFGHIKEGVGFRAGGEENAWRAHSSMYSPLARLAMTTETRGQNSWVNYGPHGDFNRKAGPGETIYADQKIGLLPMWVSEQGANDYDATAMASWTTKRIEDLLSLSADPVNPDQGLMHAVRMSPDQFLGLTASEQGRALLSQPQNTLGELDVEKLRAAGPIMLSVSRTAERTSVYRDDSGELVRDVIPEGWRVMGHDGRHRMQALHEAGVTSVPVMLHLHEAGRPATGLDEGAGYRASLMISPQRGGRNDQANSGFAATEVFGVEPITFGNRAKLTEVMGAPQARVLFQSEADLVEQQRARLFQSSATLAGHNPQSRYMVLYEPQNRQETDARDAEGQSLPAVGDPSADKRSAEPSEEQGELFPGYDLGLSPEYADDFIEVDGVERPTNNANGERIARGATQLRNFWRWFGDSQMVDSDGRPLVFYHGTKYDVQNDGWENFAFDPAMTQTFFFALDRSTAVDFAADKDRGVISAYLAAESVDEYDAEGRMWSEVLPIDDYDLQNAQSAWADAQMEAFEPESTLEEEGDFWVLNDLSEGTSTQFDTYDEAEEALLEAQDRERDQYRDNLDYLYEGDLAEEGYLESTGTSTDALAAEAMGRYDAVLIYDVDEGAGSTTVAIMLNNPNAIKATSNRGGFDPADARIMFQSDEAVFYSALSRAVDAVKMAKAPAAQWKATLTNAPGVKAEELEWSGLLDLLDTADKMGETLTKQQLVEALTRGGVRVQEVVNSAEGNAGSWQDRGYTVELAADDRWEARDAGGYLFGEYRWYDDAVRAVTEAAQDNAMQTTQFGEYTSDPGNQTYRELLLTLPRGEGTNPERSPSTHWDQPDVVAHVRFMDKQDVDGKRVLFIEEVQSDWHQKGRQQGYQTKVDPALVEAAQQKLRALNAAYEDAQRVADNLTYAALKLDGPDNTDEEFKAAAAEGVKATEEAGRLKRERDLAGRELDIAKGLITNGGIPDAPFRTSWAALAMKRTIRWAVDNGYERVAWINGDQQNGGVTEQEEGVKAFYDRNLVNVTNAILKKSGGKVAGVALPDNGGVSPARQQRAAYNATLAQVRAVLGPSESPSGMWSVMEIDQRMDRLSDRALDLREAELQKRIDALEEVINNPNAPDRMEEAVPGYRGALADLQKQLTRLRETRAEAAEGKGVLAERRAEYEAQRKIVEAAQEAADAPTPAAEPTNHGFDITPELAKAAAGGFPLFQNPTAPRGQIALGQDKIVISLFANSNLSTLIHETGHLFLERMQVDAAHPSATPELKADWAALENWLTNQGHPITNGVISRDAHELIARGFERYTMEGKAPSAQLQGVFASMRAWLLRIYAVVQNLRSPITPELREVFDRMLATQTEIDDMRAAQISDTEVDTFMAKEMTAEEFKAYRALSESAKHEAYDQLLFKTMAKIRRRQTERYKESEKAVREDVQRAVYGEPRHVALHLLRTGKFLNDPERPAQAMKLDREWLEDTFGEGATERLPKGTIIWKEGGVAADDIASMTGFGSGKEMVEALFALQTEKAARVASGDTRPVREAQIDEQVKAEMDSRGESDIIDDGSIEEEAIAAVNNARQGEVIATQVRQLARRTRASPTPYAAAREWAKRKIMAGEVREVASKSAQQRYARAAAKASRAAEKAILDGNIDEAFRQKQAQMLNHALLVEAKAAGDEVDVIVRRLDRLARRAAMKSVDQDYMDRIHALLEDYDFRPRSQALLDERESFAVWAAAQQAKGFEVHVPQRLLAAGEPYSRMAVEELIGLNDTVASLLALGKHKQTLLDGQAEREFAAVRQQILDNLKVAPARKLPASPINEASRTGMTARRLSMRSAVAGLLKIGTIAKDIDNGDPNGPMSNLLIQRATEAENLRARLREQVLLPLSKMYLNLTGKAFSRLQDKVTIPELTWNSLAESDPRLGQTVVLTRMELLAVALNTGNLSNLEKMSKGERWPAKTIQMVLDRELSASDWVLVQGMWDQVETLWPEIVKVERELSGVVPEKVDALPIVNRHGEYRGGYWPVVYDVDRSQRAENNADKSADDMFGLVSGVGTPKGHTITRTNAVGPIRFSVEDVLLRHVEQVITRIAYAAYARDVIRVIEDPAIRGAIDTKMGSEYRRQIKPWLQRQISSYVDKRGTAWWEKVFRQARINTTVVGMGFRLSTGVAQISGLWTSAGRIGPVNVAKGMGRAMTGIASAMAGQGNPQIEFIFERSEEMRRRINESTREVDDVFRKLQGRHTIIDEAQQWAFWHIAMVDLHLVAAPTWLGAHQKAIDEGMTDYQASRYADQAVLTSQGGSRAKDLAALQAPNSEAMKFFTMFYTPFNVLFNAQWEAVRGVKRGEYNKAAQLTFFFLVAQMLSDALLSGDFPEPDEEGDWTKGGLEWVGRNVFFGLFSGVPVVRDAATYAERTITGQYASFGGTPITRIGEEVIRSGQNAKGVIYDDKEIDPKMLPGAANTVGLFTGLPLGQPGTTAKFLWQYERGEVEPTTFADWYGGLVKGKMPEKETEEETK